MARKFPTPQEVDMLVDPDIIKAGTEAKAVPYQHRTNEQNEAYIRLQVARGDAWRILITERFGKPGTELADLNAKPKRQYGKGPKNFDSRNRDRRKD